MKKLISWLKDLHFHKWEFVEKIIDEYGSELYFYKCGKCKKYKILTCNIPLTADYITEDLYKMYSLKMKKYYNSLVIINRLKEESMKRCRSKK